MKYYVAEEIEIIDNSARMIQTEKRFFWGLVTGPVGAEGIPDEIKVGDRITVNGVIIKANFI